ncbi:Hypothetical predicted protein [Olea europaea subsp. europaea]|uniref:Uncharacterized protein n=1 Tax=Olea europaea subsp. europaea TaxID=158383 RepID=A0A8S0PZB6_OLEEU|nr:Hypothetical predicted protein [Olea europaea subsp. europaea]
MTAPAWGGDAAVNTALRPIRLGPSPSPLSSTPTAVPYRSFYRIGALKGLYLSGNQFSGEIPSDYFSTVSGLKKVGLSGNNFIGPIPLGLVKFNARSFKGNAGLCGENIVGILMMRRRQEPTNPMIKENLDDSVDLSAPSVGKKDLESSQKDLMKAAAEVLASGTLGCSYKATMGCGLIVAVKRIKEMNKMGNDQFDAQTRRVERLKHRNVLIPLAYHYRKDEKLLVIDFFTKHFCFTCLPVLSES